MRAARARVQEANGRVREAIASALPQVSGSVTYSRQIDSIFEGLGDGAEADTGLGAIFSNTSFGAANQWNAALTASQLLWSNKVGAAIKGASYYKQAALERQRETSGDLAYQVTRAYYDAAATQRMVAIADSGLQQARDHMEQVALYYREGTRAEYDLLRARVDAANAEPSAVAARTAYELAMLDLKRLTNVPLDQPVTLTTPLDPEDGALPVVLGEVPEADRGSLVAAGADVKLQQQAVRVAQASDWPELSASTTLSHQAFPEDAFPEREEFRRDWQAQVKVSVPIFSGFRTQGQAAQAKAALALAQAQRDQITEQVRIEIARARFELERTRALVAARRTAVAEATRAHQLAGVRYGNGLSTQLEVSDSRLAMETAEVHQVQATRDYLIALADLRRALGRTVATERRSIETLGFSLEEGRQR
jgi:outer membrane protein TolC